jgi:hypothetical protein
MTQTTLVELSSFADFEAETLAMHHAIKHYFKSFSRDGTKAFSLRQDGEPQLTMSAPPDGIVRHVVGPHNRRPTEAELETLEPLLQEQGLTLKYTPNLTA